MELPSNERIVAGGAAVGLLIVGLGVLATQRRGGEQAAEVRSTTSSAPATAEVPVELTTTTVEVSPTDPPPLAPTAPSPAPAPSSEVPPASTEKPQPTITTQAPPPQSRPIYYEISEFGGDIFRNYENASGLVAHVIGGTVVPVECLQLGRADIVPSARGSWYRIAPGGAYPAGTYIASNTFVNGQPGLDGPRADPQVPRCEDLK